MQAAIMTYCLKNGLAEGQDDMASIVRLAGAEGFDLLEVNGGGWRPDQDLRAAAESLREVGNAEGVLFPVYGSGTRLGHPDAGKSGAAMSHLKTEIEVCGILGAAVLTLPIIDAQPLPPDRPEADQGLHFERLLPFILDQAVELADFAAGHSVEIAVLNHCFVCYLSWHQKWIARLTDRANLGACVDPGNYLHYGREDPVSACRALQGCAKMARAGDMVGLAEEQTVASYRENGRLRFSETRVFGEGEMDQVACYRQLKEGGFEGVVSLKTAGPSDAGPLDAIRRSMTNLRKLLGEL